MWFSGKEVKMKSFHKIPLKNPVYSAYVPAEKPVWADLEFDIKMGSKTDTRFPGQIKNKKILHKKTIINCDCSPEDKNQIKKKAYNRGLIKGKKEGFFQGKNEAQAEIEKQTKLFTSFIEELKQKKEKFYQENELFIIKLAVEIAKKIMQRELSQNQDFLLYVVREALKRIKDNGSIVFQTHPDDLDLLRNNRNFKDKHLLSFEHVEFIASDKIRRGGCVIESESGIVDAQLEVQLDRIEKFLLEGVK